MATNIGKEKADVSKTCTDIQRKGKDVIILLFRNFGLEIESGNLTL